MIGTLTFPATAPLRFVSENGIALHGRARSGLQMSFCGRTTSCRAAIHAFADAAPAMESRKSGSLYEILHLNRNASSIEIKAAYRNLAKLFHPDALPSEASSGGDFIEIHNAYATLSDPSARALYDLSLNAVSGHRQFAYAAGSRSGFYPTRRWETDQCW